MISVSANQNVNLGIWHMAVPSNMKPNVLFTQSTRFILVNKFVLFIIVATCFGLLTQVLIRLRN